MLNFTTVMLKNLIECQSKDKLRSSLCGTRLFVTKDKSSCQLTSTDGWIGIKYTDICFQSLCDLVKHEYGIDLNENDIVHANGTCILYLDNKIRKKLNKSVVDNTETYPNFENCVPDFDNSETECDVNNIPMFAIDILQRVKKITGSNIYLPDFWTTRVGATIKKIEGGYILVMPSKPKKEQKWKYYDDMYGM
jgi:hypothetical protein